MWGEHKLRSHPAQSDLGAIRIVRRRRDVRNTRFRPRPGRSSASFTWVSHRAFGRGGGDAPVTELLSVALRGASATPTSWDRRSTSQPDCAVAHLDRECL